MISLAIASVLMASALAAETPTQAGTDKPWRMIKYERPGDKTPSIMTQEALIPFDPPIFSPKKFGVPPKQWPFEWIYTGYINDENINKYVLRFRVYSQERKEKDDLGPRVSRMLSQMWWEVCPRIKMDHSRVYNGQIVDVYLCWGGRAGGEQRFDIATENGVQKNVNTIYIYDVNSFTDPVEMAREIAHEYGHALLPAIGIYKAPEDWANGYLGEKLFLGWMRDGLAAGRLKPEDVMGATQEQLDAWLAKNVDPLVTTAAATFPTSATFTDKTATGMDAYLGLATYAARVLPGPVFGRSMLLNGSIEAKDYPAALVLATEEPDEYEIQIPKLLADKAIWLPTGKGKITGGKILKLKNGWAQVVAPEGKLTVVNRRS